MNLGERCDEIVRLIDQTLADLGIGTEAGGPQATVTALPTATAGRGTGDGRTPPPVEPAPRAAAGF